MFIERVYIILIRKRKYLKFVKLLYKHECSKKHTCRSSVQAVTVDYDGQTDGQIYRQRDGLTESETDGRK